MRWYSARVLWQRKDGKVEVRWDREAEEGEGKGEKWMSTEVVDLDKEEGWKGVEEEEVVWGGIDRVGRMEEGSLMEETTVITEESHLMEENLLLGDLETTGVDLLEEMR